MEEWCAGIEDGERVVAINPSGTIISYRIARVAPSVCGTYISNAPMRLARTRRCYLAGVQPGRIYYCSGLRKTATMQLWDVESGHAFYFLQASIGGHSFRCIPPERAPLSFGVSRCY